MAVVITPTFAGQKKNEVVKKEAPKSAPKKTTSKDKK
jgi:hypothetical protein